MDSHRSRGIESPVKASSAAQGSSSSLSKRSLLTDPPKVISECSTATMIHLVSSMLQELVNLNDAIPFNASTLTRFHSRSPPRISIRDYLIRITKFCSLEKSIILAIIYYIDLLCTTYKIFNINSLTVHRFLITAAMVASKGLCDTLCTNTHYAKVGGLSKLELNSLEVEFLIRVDYRIVPPIELLDQYFERLVSRMKVSMQQKAQQPHLPRSRPQSPRPASPAGRHPNARPSKTGDPSSKPRSSGAIRKPTPLKASETRASLLTTLKPAAITELALTDVASAHRTKNNHSPC